jgi:serralysin
LNGVTNAFDDYGDFDLNQGVFTSLSYNTGYRSGDDTAPYGADYGNDAGPMALDIAVLQNLYGANTTTASGDDTYVLPSENDIGTAWQSIWDTGGNDTITFDGTRDVTIDLRAATLVYGVGGGGFISHAVDVKGGLTIASGVVIENAIGGFGEDTLIGNAAANELYGQVDSDTLFGRSGEDMLDGGTGADSLFGGTGDDALVGGNGSDALYGQSGGDNLSSDSGLNTHYGGSGFDEIVGGSGIDKAYGGSGDDVIDTGFGSDELYGGRGDDIMDGGSSNDKLTGGMGTDVMTGGSGADQFIFDYIVDSRVGAERRDTITDFASTDRINLSAIDADLTVDDDQAFTFIGTAAFSGGQGEVRIQSISGDDVVVEVDQNADGIADMEILIIDGTGLEQNDFIL